MTELLEYASRCSDVPLLAAIAKVLPWFAGKQIRNVSSLGGNVVTASPVSDLNPLWCAVNATASIGKWQDGQVAVREVPMRSFFLDYRKTACGPDELLLGL